jgi:hypothetical protein
MVCPSPRSCMQPSGYALMRFPVFFFSFWGVELLSFHFSGVRVSDFQVRSVLLWNVIGDELSQECSSRVSDCDTLDEAVTRVSHTRLHSSFNHQQRINIFFPKFSEMHSSLIRTCLQLSTHSKLNRTYLRSVPIRTSRTLTSEAASPDKKTLQTKSTFSSASYLSEVWRYGQTENIVLRWRLRIYF